MEIDTGTARSVISDNTFTQLWPKGLETSFDSQNIKPSGVISVQVEVNNQKQQLELLVVPGNRPSLLGRDWLSQLRLDWAQIHHMNHSDPLQTVLDHHPAVFEQSLGLVHGTTAKICLS